MMVKQTQIKRLAEKHSVKQDDLKVLQVVLNLMHIETSSTATILGPHSACPSFISEV